MAPLSFRRSPEGLKNKLPFLAKTESSFLRPSGGFLRPSEAQGHHAQPLRVLDQGIPHSLYFAKFYKVSHLNVIESKSRLHILSFLLLLVLLFFRYCATRFAFLISK